MMTATSSAAVGAVLAATGSDLAPWLIGAGIVIVLGAAALIIGQVVRSRRAGTAQADAAASLADAASTAAAGAGGAAAGAAGGGIGAAAGAVGGAGGGDEDAGAAGPGADPISPDDPR